MKKLAVLLGLMLITAGVTNAATENIPPITKQRPPQADFKAPPKHHGNMFEQKLQLTEVQKLKAHELRKSGHEKMKPIMEEIKAKKQEAQKIRESNLTYQAQEEKLILIDNELKDLEKKAATIRKQNMKDFESILTSSQKKKLKQMKKEGRKNFKKGGKIMPPPCPQPEHN